NAAILQPAGIRFDGAGNLYVAEPFGPVRKISPAGIISAINAFGVTGLASDGANNIYVAILLGERILKIAGTSVNPVAGNGRSGFAGDGGAAIAATLSSPTDVVVDSNGTIYIADRDNDRIRKIDPNGTITTIAGMGASVGDGGPAA